MKKIILLFILLAFLLAGCNKTENGGISIGTQEEERKKLIYDCGIAASFSASFNPIITDNGYNFELSSMLFDKLFEINDNFIPVPAVAKSAEMEQDGKLCRIIVRDGISFSDGSNLTATDVEKSLKLAKENPASHYRERLSNVEMITVISGSELEITLTKPNTNFPAMLAIPIIKNGNASAKPIGSGKYEFDGENKLVANENWALGTVETVKSINLIDVKNNEEVIEKLASDEIDFAFFSSSEISRLSLVGNYTFCSAATNEICYLGVASGGRLRDTKMRRAISAIIDRGGIIKEALAGNAYATISPINPAWELYKSPSISDNAAEILEELGYRKDATGFYKKNGNNFSLTVGVNENSFTLVEVAKAFARNMQAAGIEVKIARQGDSNFSAACANGTIDIYISLVKITPDMNVGAICGASGALNFGHTGSAEADAAIAGFFAASPDESANAASVMVSALYNEQNVIPLYYNTVSVIFKRALGAELSPNPYDPYAGLENIFNELDNKPEE